MEELLNNYYNCEKEVSKSLSINFEKTTNETDFTNMDVTVDSNLVNSGNLVQNTRNNLVINMDSTNLEPIKEAECMENIPQSIHVGKESVGIITVLKKKRLAVIDSDSEFEESTKIDKIVPSKEEISNNLNSVEMVPETSTNLQNKVIVTFIFIFCYIHYFQDKWSALCDSDSSDNEIEQSASENRTNKITEGIEEQQIEISILKKHKSRIKSRLNSDSENEQQDESQYNEEETYTLGSKGELILETSNNLIKKVRFLHSNLVILTKLNFRVNGLPCVIQRVLKMK